MKKRTRMVSIFLTAMLLLAGCGSKDAAGKTEGNLTGGSITMLAREDGSGTRGAFVELFDIEEETEEAKITNSTSVMMTTVHGDVNAIGYISLGSLNDTVKALKIDGEEATTENVAAGKYKIVRPFSIAVKEDINKETEDFIAYILSKTGQNIVEENGYIAAESQPSEYKSISPKGKIVVAGSSSVTPVMEKLKEAYSKENPDVEIEIQQSDSTTGMQAAIEGLCDIGMASRALKSSEIDGGLKDTVIAQDGIAVIVNNSNTIEELTSDQIKALYSDQVHNWGEFSK